MTAQGTGAGRVVPGASSPGAQRFLLTGVVCKYRRSPPSEDWDREELLEDRQRMVELFTSLGYEHLPDLGPNPDKWQIEEALNNCRQRAHPDDYLVVYLAGHGWILDVGEAGTEHVFLPADTDPQDLGRHAIRTADLGKWLLADTSRSDRQYPSRVCRLLLVLDTCYSGQGALDFAGEAAKRVRLSNLPNQPDGSGVVVISATRPKQLAVPGAFTNGFDAAVRSALETAPNGVASFEMVMGALGAQRAEATPDLSGRPAGSQSPQYCIIGSGRIPNFFARDSQEVTVEDSEKAYREQQRRRAKEMRTEFAPRTEGFKGRAQALARIVRWLNEPTELGPLIVTGEAGSGKSAVLGMLAALSDDERRDTVPRQGLSRECIPEPKAIDVAIYAAGLKTGEILAGLAATAGVRGIGDDSEVAIGVRELLKVLRVRERPLVALIDALDEVGEVKTSNEVTGPPQVVEQLLLPLIHGGEGKIRLLLAARPTLCKQLGRDWQNVYPVVDLDRPPYEDPGAVVKVVGTILQASPPPAGDAETAGSVFRNAPTVLLDDVTKVIADTAGHSFLVAKIVAGTEGAKEELPDPRDRRWRAELPREAGSAMRHDLVLRLGDEAERATDLLRPLAYARGDGLPWEDIWLRLANILSPGHGYTIDDLLWVSGHAGSFVKQVDPADEEEDGPAGAGRRYRLSHRVLAEGLQEGRNQISDEHAIVVALQQQAPQLGGGRTDWANAHAYTLRHLADHADASGDIDSLAQDPGFLLAADRPQLLAALDSTSTPQGRAAADAYRSALPALRRPAVEEHAAYLGLAARRGRAAALADRLRADAPSGPWSAQWAAWHAQRPHLTIAGHASPVGAVVAREVRRRLGRGFCR